MAIRITLALDDPLSSDDLTMFIRRIKGDNLGTVAVRFGQDGDGRPVLISEPMRNGRIVQLPTVQPRRNGNGSNGNGKGAASLTAVPTESATESSNAPVVSAPVVSSESVPAKRTRSRRPARNSTTADADSGAESAEPTVTTVPPTA
jgi:hypothetical protein